MSRPSRITLTVTATVAFLLVSFAVAQALSARGAERGLLEKVMTDQAAGRTAAVTELVTDCTGDCAKSISELVRSVAVPGRRMLLLQIEQGTSIAPFAGQGVARVAWRSDGHLPVVECVATRRSGNVVGGFDVSIEAIQRLKDPEGSCPPVEAVVSRKRS